MTIDGAGVNLNRLFGFAEIPAFDPFLLFDAFGSDDPKDYQAGFPWHPHRGIETITYMLEGQVEHQDSLGNRGTLGPGDVQWMTAGSGIIHQEMPMEGPSHDGRMFGFQLWVNLPASSKMIPPRYQEYPAADIPEAQIAPGISVRPICGAVTSLQGETITGPVMGLAEEIDPEYFDVRIAEGLTYTREIDAERTAIIHVVSGRISLDGIRVDAGSLALYADGGTRQISVRADGQEARILVIAGNPLGEPIAWGGPIVMNTREELSIAFREYAQGTFVRK